MWSRENLFNNASRCTLQEDRAQKSHHQALAEFNYSILRQWYEVIEMKKSYTKFWVCDLADLYLLFSLLCMF